MAATATPKRIKWEATVDDLYRVPEKGKAELVDGKLVRMTPTGFLPGRAGGAIYRSLADYEERTGRGFAIPDNIGFIVKLPNRRSFSPDAAFHVGKPTGGKFLEGAPLFAVEVRSEEDYGPRAEKRMARKRADYFEAGTRIVWGVGCLAREGGAGPRRSPTRCAAGLSARAAGGGRACPSRLVNGSERSLRAHPPPLGNLAVCSGVA